MENKEDLKKFYEGWATRQLESPDRDVALKWKAVNMAVLILRRLKSQKITHICEIGGAEGTVIKTLGDIVNATHKENYELSSVFCKVGKYLYPDVEFINTEFTGDDGIGCRDIIILSDVTEHVIDDLSFLDKVSESCKYVVLKMPIEKCLISHQWVFSLLGRKIPVENQFGSKHHNGHLRGYTIRSALSTVSQSFDVLDYKISDVTYFYPSKRALLVKKCFGERITTYIFGGALFVLAKAK